MRARVALGALAALVFAASAHGGPPSSTVMVSRPAGFGPLTPPVVNDSASSSFTSSSRVGQGATLAGARVSGGPAGNPQFVVFLSGSDGLSPDDDNHLVNAYVRDLQTGTVTLVSRGSNGEAANDDTDAPAISADGSTVVFASAASNLVPNVSGGVERIYRRNLNTQTTTLVSRASDNDPADSTAIEPSVSGDGSVVAFTSNASNLGGGNGSHYQVYVRNGLDDDGRERAGPVDDAW